MSANIRHSSASNEHYTPTRVVEPARTVLGQIDLDSASCAFANETVGAKAYLTDETDGLRHTWFGNVFLNPPGGRIDSASRRVLPKCRETGACGLPVGHTHEMVDSSQRVWWFKLAAEFAAGRVSAAIFVCFSLELLQVTQVATALPIPLDFPICFPSRRVAYMREEGGRLVEGSSPPHASAIVYLGSCRRLFAETFGAIGRVVLPELPVRQSASPSPPGPAVAKVRS